MHNLALKVLSIVILALVVFLSSSFPKVYAGNVYTDSNNRIPSSNRGKYETNLFSGSASYSYSMKVPEGTNGLTPEVVLSYNSTSAHDYSQRFGIGWQLEQNFVERDVNYTPNNETDDKYKLHFKGSTYELVYVAAEDRYHTKIESYLKIEKKSVQDNTYKSYWLVTDKSGTQYRFGYAQNSEEVCTNRLMARNYYIDQVTDIHNNHIYYTYTNTNNLLHLSKIEYNTDKQRIVEFGYSYPYERKLYIQGCFTKETARLNTITVKVGATLVRQYDLNYTQSLSGQQLLQSIVEKGNNGSALPATEFSYKEQEKTFKSPDDKWLQGVQLDYTDLNRSDTRLIDVNGDVLPDIVRTYGDSSITYKVWMNTGSTWTTQWQDWMLNNPFDAGLNDSYVRLMDVTGDALPDIVKAASADAWRVWRNTGASWSTQEEAWGNYTSIHSEVNLSNPRVRLVDVTGDNLPDIVRSWWNNGQQYEVIRNLGYTWESWYTVWSFNGIGVGLDDPNVRIIDVNGDNLGDLVRTTNNGSLSTWMVYKNNGNGWDPTADTWINNADINAYLSMHNITVSDVNGDNLADIIKITDHGVNDRWEVLLNTGNGWTTTWELWITGLDADAEGETNVVLADIDGDTHADILKTVHHSGGVVDWWVWKNNNYGSDLLTNIKTSQGGIVDFEYKPSTKFDNTGPDDRSDLPFALWVVSKMTVNNGMNTAQNTNDITTYTYKDGFYNSSLKEFQGFSIVNTVEPNGSKKEYMFHQYQTLTGKLNSEKTKDSQNNPYHDYYPTWTYNTVNGVTTANLIEDKYYTYDGNATNPKITQVNYEYDSYGNLTRKAELGETATSGDERFTYNQYTYNTTAWILDTLKHTYTNASNDTTKVSESWLYYDNNTSIDTAPSKGDVTKEVKWLDTSGASNPTTLYTYDSYGNQTSVTDPNNHTTTMAYGGVDTTYTYPDSVTNAKNQTATTVYDLGTGNLLSKTDSNGLTTSYTYDAFGRVSKEIKQYDSVSYPSVSYQYSFDGSAPEGIVVSTRKESSASGTLDVATYIDGLGRKIQTRADAENSSDQIVTDTYYDANGEVIKETVPYYANTSAPASPPTPAVPSATKFGDGSDGDITIASNITESPVDSAVAISAGTRTATVGSGLGFSPNQIVLLHQTQGANAGIWEFARVEAYSGTTLTLTTNVTNTYSSTGNNHAQVRVVRQYYDVNVHAGATWSVKPWNGTTGGIMAFLAKGTVTINGTISANGGKGGSARSGFSPGGIGGGFRGGQGDRAIGNGVNAWVGEGHPGPSFRLQGDQPQSTHNGNGGGAPSFNNGGIGRSGAGGGNGIGGGATDPSTGGDAYGTADLSTMTFGGGGGGGGRGYLASDGIGTGGGGSGGGIVFITGANLTIAATGKITANGGGGGLDYNNNHANGGGGAGGSILLKSQSASLGSGVITANGGQGYQGGGVGGVGNGGSGRIRVQYENSISGTTTPTASSSQATLPTIPAGVVPVQPPASAYGVYVTPDPVAKATEYTYDVLGRVTIIENPNGDNKTIAYDHWKETEIDENGHIKRRYLNAHNKITKVEEVNNTSTYTTNYEYNARNELTKVIDNSDNQFEFAYDSLGRKKSQDDPDMGHWEYTYDNAGNLKTVKDNRNITTTLTYDELNRLLIKDYPNDADVTYTYDGNNKKGTLTSVVDAAGTVSYLYDNRLRKVSEQRNIGGTSKTTSYTYDSLDRLKSQTNPDNETITYTHNNQGEVESVSGLITNFNYNALGKITQKSYANNLTTNYTYSTSDFRLNRIQTGSVQDLSFAYDAVGNITGRTNNLTNKQELFTYDDLDRLKTASESGGYNYAYTYNPIGNLTKFTDSGNEITYEYGAGAAGPHAVTARTGTGSTPTPTVTPTSTPTATPTPGNNGSPYGGTAWAVPGTIQAEDFNTGGDGVGYHDQDSSNNGNAYRTNEGVDISEFTSGQYNLGWNLEGEWLKYTINVSTAGTYTFNARVGSPNDNSKFHIEIDGVNVSGPIEIDNTGGWGSWNIVSKSGISLTAGQHILKVVFDTRSTQEQWIGDFDWFSFTAESGATPTPTATVTPTPGNDGNPYGGTARAIPGTVQAEDFNTGGNGVGYHDQDSSNNGNAYRTSEGVDISEFTSGQYNLGWNLEGEWLKYTINATASGTYTFNARVGSPNDNSKFHIEIDGVNVSGPIEIDNTGGWGSWNIVSKSGINITAGQHVLKVVFDTRSTQEQWVGDFDWFSFAIESFSTPSSAATYTYDANGNMTSDGTKCFEYNDENQLKKVKNCANNLTIAEYVYDFNGLRMIKKNYTGGTLSNTVISWSDSFETRVIVGGATENTTYYFANKLLIAKKNPDGTKYFIHTDHLGSTSVITNATGGVVEETKYDPWGEVKSGGTKSKFLYTGQERDAETGLHYYNARYYNSDIRRFTQPDKVIQDVYDPQSLNRYSYVRNNPLKYTDPSGNISISNVFNSIKQAASSVVNFVSNIVKPKPANNIPISTAKLPDNKIFKETKVNVTGNNKNNNGNITIAAPDNSVTTAISNYVSKIMNEGSIDISVGASLGPLGGSAGSKINNKGKTPTAGTSLGYSAKLGGTVIFSNKPVNQHSIEFTNTFSLIGAIQTSYDPLDPYNASKWKFEGWGFGCCGLEGGFQYTGITEPHSDPRIEFRSKSIEDIYGH